MKSEQDILLEKQTHELSIITSRKKLYEILLNNNDFMKWYNNRECLRDKSINEINASIFYHYWKDLNNFKDNPEVWYKIYVYNYEAEKILDWVLKDSAPITMDKVSEELPYEVRYAVGMYSGRNTHDVMGLVYRLREAHKNNDQIEYDKVWNKLKKYVKLGDKK
jgi:hypothetical protein